MQSSVVASNQKRQAICSNLARLLREERQRKNFSMNVLAARSGISRQMVSYIEQEERNPTVDTLLRITEVLGVELDELIRKARKAAGNSKSR